VAGILGGRAFWLGRRSNKTVEPGAEVQDLAATELLVVDEVNGHNHRSIV
jgi:hypothetical protein